MATEEPNNSMLDKVNILFVDDDPNVLNGLRRMLRSLRSEWDFDFCDCGEEALRLLDRSSYDVVVSDMRMPGMNGAQLLEEVRLRQPKAARIILSGHCDEETALKSVGPVHQYLSKPCDAGVLKNTITRACALRGLLEDDSIKEVVSRIECLPSLPSLYFELMDELASETCSFGKVEKVIRKDPAMAAKILQLVNSAFFGVRRRITDPSEAIGMLGFQTIKALVLSVHIFCKFDSSMLPDFSIESLWNRAVSVAVAARDIANAETGDKCIADDAFMSGILHDVGKLILAQYVTDKYTEVLRLVRTERLAELQAEQRILNTTHAELGAYLLALWGLPDSIVEAIMFHHRPGASADLKFSPLTAVHVADALFPNSETSDSGDSGVSTVADDVIRDSESQVDLEYLARLGLDGRLTKWRDICHSIYEEAA